MWEIGWTDEFAEWVDGEEVDEAAREAIRACLIVLGEIGPALGRPPLIRAARRFC